MISSIVKSSNEVFKSSAKVTTFHWQPHRFHAGHHAGFFDTIQRKCVSYKCQNKLFKTKYHFNPDASLLHCKVDKVFEILESSNKQMETEQLQSSLLVKHLKIFKEVENTSAKILQRYNDCRDCKWARSMRSLKP